MIILETTIALENYDKLFDLLAQMDDRVRRGKTFSHGVQFKGGSWSFVAYHPKRVASFHLLAPVIDDPEFQEAYQQELGLLEICAGDYKNPQYIAVTPNIDMNGLKRIWCRDYCRVHGLALSETDGEDEIFDLLAETRSVIPYAHAVNAATVGGAL